MCALQHQLDFSRKQTATLQLLREEYSLTYPPLAIAMYSFIRLNELEQREVKEFKLRQACHTSATHLCRLPVFQQVFCCRNEPRTYVPHWVTSTERLVQTLLWNINILSLCICLSRRRVISIQNAEHKHTPANML